MSSPPPRLTLVIPTLNREARLHDTIRSVRQQTFPDWELIIVDQSADAEASARRTSALRDPRIKHRILQPSSLTQARNYATLLSNADLVVFIDDDVELHPGFLGAYVEAFANPGVQAVAGRVVLPGDPARAHPLAIGVGGAETGSFNCPIDQDASTAQGCNMAFRKSALLALGGFDSRFAENAHRDESDFCFRLRKAGGRIVYRKNAALTHYPARAGGCRPAGNDRWHKVMKCRNETLFFLKHWPLWQTPLFVRNQVYPGHGGDLRPKEPQAIVQLLCLSLGFIIGLWVYLTKKPANLSLRD